MAGVVELRTLLDQALGQPERGVVDFKLLKEFLLHVLVANTHAENAGISPNSEVGVKNGAASGVTLLEDPKALERFMHGNSLEQDLKSVREKQDDIAKRLLKIENENSKFAPLDSLPSGEELLSKRRGLLDNSKNESSPVEGQVSLYNEEVEESGEPGSGKFLNNSWNNVRVNKRLQALEDGVDKLFAMLDILTNEQKKLKGAYNNDRENDIVEEMRKLKDDVTAMQTRLDKMNGFENDIAAVNKRLDIVEQTLDTFKASNKNLANDDVISDLEKRLRDLEATNSKDDYSKFDKELADLKKRIEGLTPRKEMVEYVKWSALEDALDVRGYLKRGSENDKDTPEKDDIQKEGSIARKSVNEERLPSRTESGKNQRERSPEKLDSVDGTSLEGGSEINRGENENGSHTSEGDKQDGTQLTTEDQAFEPPSGKESQERHPSAALQDCLRRLSEMASKYGDMESKYGDMESKYGDMESKYGDMESKYGDLESKIDSLKASGKPIEENRSLDKELDALKQQITSTNQIAECNKSLIDSARADIDRLLSNFGKEDNDEDEVGNSINAIKEHLIELDERETKTSTGLANLNANVYKELKAKQQLIDALYECVEQLQRSKADIGNATSIFDLEAYKKALDTKVSMNDFDQMMLGLQKSIEDLLQRLDRYASEEESLKEALERMNDNMREKLDATAEESLKKYLESRISQLQKSRDNLVSQAGQHIITKAAGFRRPLSTLFHCISCDRPVHLDGTGNAISTHYRKYKGASNVGQLSKSNEVSPRDEKSSMERNSWRDPFSVSRACGGNHTTVAHSPKKGIKPSPHKRADIGHLSRSFVDQRKRENTIVDMLLGTDGNVYRGRYKLTDLRYGKENHNFASDRRHLRSRSAEARRPTLAGNQHSNGIFSNPNSRSSIRSLPPIDNEALISSTPTASFRIEHREARKKNGENEVRD
ncbi:paramyosin-like isoform X2 [Rhopilema esculentum]|uniref:paramyosin-like isoform X2 n=1 Tax=Rhopilema esculentum TaxID=499914 RepID=UPI0031D5016F